MNEEGQRGCSEEQRENNEERGLWQKKSVICKNGI